MENRLSASAGWRFCLKALVLPIVGTMAALELPRLPWYQRWCDPTWIHGNEYAYRRTDERCDVVIFGDSTAITGLDPERIEAATHLSTCNVAQSLGNLVVNGTDALDRFLARIPRPRLIVLAFSPVNYRRFRSWDESRWVEGVLVLLRHHSRAEATRALMEHPIALAALLHYTYLEAPRELVRNLSSRPSEKLTGHYVLPRLPATTCTPYSDYAHAIFELGPDPAFIAALRERYAARADDVIVDVSPLDECEPDFEEFTIRLRGVVDNVLERYPDRMFSAGAIPHLTIEGANAFSDAVAGQIAERLGQPSKSVR
jgi:hypothetical protein